MTTHVVRLKLFRLKAEGQKPNVDLREKKDLMFGLANSLQPSDYLPKSKTGDDHVKFDIQ